MQRDPQMSLENQLCFPFYAASHTITRLYRPYLENLGVTYPQYLVLLVLWEKDEQPVTTVADRLFLKTNTITPLLKRMEKDGLLTRQRSNKDERKVVVRLTNDGLTLYQQAKDIPLQIANDMRVTEKSTEELQHVCQIIKKLILNR